MCSRVSFAKLPSEQVSSLNIKTETIAQLHLVMVAETRQAWES